MTQFGEFDWGWVSAFRLFTVLVLICFIYQMAIMLSHYWFRIIPLRREIDPQMQVLAPPILWTFAYHLLVALTFGVVGIAMVQALYKGSPGTVFAFAAPFLLGALTVVVNRFSKYYSQTLSTEYRRHIGPE